MPRKGKVRFGSKEFGPSPSDVLFSREDEVWCCWQGQFWCLIRGVTPGCRRQRFSRTVLCTFCVLSRCNPCVILAHTLLNLKTGLGCTLSASGDGTCHQRQDTSLQLWGFHWLPAPAAVPQNECPALTSPRCWWGLGIGKNHLVSNQNSGKFSFSGRFWSQRYSHDA